MEEKKPAFEWIVVPAVELSEADAKVLNQFVMETYQRMGALQDLVIDLQDQLTLACAERDRLRQALERVEGVVEKYERLASKG